jgi:hypothetical protein
MRENFITYEQALALKELGFNEPCLLEEYFEDGKCISEWSYEKPFKINTELDHLTDKFNADDDEHYEYSVAAPLKQQVFKWFRDKHKIQGYIYPLTVQGYKNGRIFTNYIYTIKDLYYIIESDPVNEEFKTYEEAESACIDKLISILKEKKS